LKIWPNNAADINELKAVLTIQIYFGEAPRARGVGRERPPQCGGLRAIPVEFF